MTEVLSAQRHFGGFLPSTSPRASPPQPSRSSPDPSYHPISIPRSHLSNNHHHVERLGSPINNSPNFRLPASLFDHSSRSHSSAVPQNSPTKSFPVDIVSSSLPTPPAPDHELATNPEMFPVYDYGPNEPSPPADESLTPPPPFGNEDNNDTNSTLTSPESTVPSTNISRPESPVNAIVLDDSAITPEPTRHVDYLSHDWKEEEIWSSWRYMIGRKKQFVNAARLENASWRSWAKARNRLKTVSPEKLNWMKDVDVTWLYGPLSTGEEKSLTRQSKSPTTPNSGSGGSPGSRQIRRMQHTGSFLGSKRPILKKRSASELMLRKSLSSSSLLRQAADMIQSQQAQSLGRPNLPPRSVSDFGSSSFAVASRSSHANTSDYPSAISSGIQSPTDRRHIHFNEKVEQCIAVDQDDAVSEPDRSAYIDSDDSSEDGLVMSLGPRRSVKESNLSSMRSSARGSFSEPPAPTIAMLPATTLKFDHVEPAKTPTLISPSVSTSNFLFDEDDEEVTPPSTAISSRRDSISVTRARLEGVSLSSERNFDDVPAFSQDDDEEDEQVAAGLFGRAVDAVNTARDIAHVIWNVGWRTR